MAEFARQLAVHPDQSAVFYVVNGFRHNFRLGFHSSLRLKSAKANKPSARQHPSVKDDYLPNEVSLHRVAGPFASLPLPNLHISGFGVIPKRGQPGKWRLIVVLSSPGGYSVNDGIDPEEFSLQYIKVDQIILMVSKYGSGALMAKFDDEAAYRNIAVHPDDRFLLGMKWRGKYFVDLALPFGLRSAPFIFNSVADMLEWILLHGHHLSDFVHYLNDYQRRATQFRSVCSQFTNRLVRLPEIRPFSSPWQVCWPFNSAGGPGHRARLRGAVRASSRGKLVALRELIASWRHRRQCFRTQLESLIGHHDA